MIQKYFCFFVALGKTGKDPSPSEGSRNHGQWLPADPNFYGKDFVAIDPKHYSPSKGSEKVYSEPGMSDQVLEALVIPV